MKSFLKAIAILMLSTATLFVASCKPEEEPNNGGDGNEEFVNPNYVSIDWDNATLLSSNDSIGEYQIQFSGEVPNLKPGSVIAIDRDTAVYYRFIEATIVNGNTVSIASTEAYLTDIFADTEFTLSTSLNGKSQSRGSVYYPTKVFLFDEDGSYHIVDMNGARDDSIHFTHNLWHYGDTLDGIELLSGDNFKLYMKKLYLNFDIDLEMKLNFGGRDEHEFSNNGLDRWKSKAMKVNAALVGTFDAEQMVRCDVWGNCEYSPGPNLWKPNFFEKTGIKIPGPGGVPIYITLSADLLREVQLTAEGEVSAYTGFKEHAKGKLGFEWSQTEGMKPVNRFNKSFVFTPPTIEGKGKAQAKVWVFPRIKVFLYNCLGPSFDVKPYLSTTLSGGFKEQMLGQSNDFCAWSLDCNTGIDVCCGLNFRFLGLEANHTWPGWNAFDKLLYHSPHAIEHISVKGNGGRNRTESFYVFDSNYLAGCEVLTPLPQFVKFEANGQLSSEYGIAQNGQVSVDWTPSSNDILYAKLYDIDGNVMAWDTVKAPDDRWVDLGLPSGTLWAKWNVGANAPEEYGDYFAWGETEPKSVYSAINYLYGYEVNDYPYHKVTKYNTNHDFGPVDNLTALDPEDDAASVIWEDEAHIPTYDDWRELYSNSIPVWTTHNNIKGICFTGPNGNSIFLPAAGQHYYNDFLYYNYQATYWSNTLYTNKPNDAWFFIGESEETFIFGMENGYRFGGLPVRAVRPSHQN